MSMDASGVELRCRGTLTTGRLCPDVGWSQRGGAHWPVWMVVGVLLVLPGCRGR